MKDVLSCQESRFGSGWLKNLLHVVPRVVDIIASQVGEGLGWVIANPAGGVGVLRRDSGNHGRQEHIISLPKRDD